MKVEQEKIDLAWKEKLERRKQADSKQADNEQADPKQADSEAQI